METVKDPVFVDALLPLVIIIFIIGLGVVLLYQHFQKNLFTQKLKQEALKSLHQNELLRANIQAQEEERKRIAQDLHDELGAVLSIMRMNMVMLEQQNKEVPGSLVAGLQNIRQLSETALASVRSISHRLMPPQLEAFGLVKTLESVTEQANAAGNINIQLNVAGCFTRLSWPLNLGLYRIIMELLNNTLKHAGATEVKIELQQEVEYVICRYSDNGRGMKDNNASKGLGHKNIDGRINALGGTLGIDTAHGAGFSAIIQIPIGSSFSPE